MYRWFVLTTQPLDAAFFAQLSSHKAQLVAVQQYLASHPGAPQPLIPFTFQLPPYTETAQFRADSFNVLAMTKMLEINPLRAVQQQLQPGQDPFQEWLQLPQDTVLQPFHAQLVRTMETRGIEYFTLGRLYDLRVQEDDVLVLVFFDSEIEIFKLEDVMQVLMMTAEEVRDEMEPSAYGHVLQKNFSDEFYAAEHGILPLGRVAQWLREEDVAIRDGKEGRPHWITAAGFVYDLTDLEELASESQSNLVETLMSAPGSNPIPRVFLGDHDFDEALALIEPLKIGMTLPFGLADESGSKDVLTDHEIGWNQFPQTRQYIQIHEHVYDITDYADWHPGGTSILTHAAGTNATTLFEEYHSENGEDLLEAIQGLRHGMEDLPAMNEAELATHDGETFDSLISERVHKMINSGNYCNNIFRFELSPDWSSMTRPLEQWLQKQVGGKPIETGH
ncbi:Cytochrome b5 domain-containing protein RLF like [Verticillium longisporum]|uniref:Cytochrome b5 domain-containing protein RLF like n=1 Tax=Verticillium longisporum TaxID=100787 RepID=A0A8I2ZYC3_VERLO|nr:Cytochrome b5 domain-containing protein RLF like [Verticillium longisporum]